MSLINQCFGWSTCVFHRQYILNHETAKRNTETALFFSFFFFRTAKLTKLLGKNVREL